MTTTQPIETGVSTGTRGVGLMLASAFLFALLGLFVKLLGPSFRVWDIAVYRFGGGFILLLILFGRKEALFKPSNPGLMIIRGVTGSVAFITIVFAIQMISLSKATVFFYSYPAFAALFAPLVFAERPSLIGLIWIAVAMVGVAVLFDFRLEGALPGQLSALVSAAFAGLTVVFIRKLRENHGPAIIYFFFCLIGGLISIGPYLADPRIPQTPLEWTIVMGIIFSSVSAQLLMNQGFQYCKSWEGGLFMTTEVIFASTIGILFLSEAVSWRFWVGGLLIVGSAAAFNLHSRSR